MSVEGEIIESEQGTTSNAGRPTKYVVKFNRLAYKLALLGATDKQMANIFEVAESTLHKWKLDYPKFSESIKRGKEDADAMVASSLFKRALGYDRKEVVKRYENDDGQTITIQKQIHVPADTTAAIFWLKNRQPQIWRDKHEFSLPDMPVQFTNDVPRPVSDGE